MTYNFELTTNKQAKQNVLNEGKQIVNDCDLDVEIYIYKRYAYVYVVKDSTLYREVHGLFGTVNQNITVSEFIEEFYKWYNDKNN